MWVKFICSVSRYLTDTTIISLFIFSNQNAGILLTLYGIHAALLINGRLFDDDNDDGMQRARMIVENEPPWISIIF